MEDVGVAFDERAPRSHYMWQQLLRRGKGRGESQYLLDTQTSQRVSLPTSSIDLQSQTSFRRAERHARRAEESSGLRDGFMGWNMSRA